MHRHRGILVPGAFLAFAALSPAQAPTPGPMPVAPPTVAPAEVQRTAVVKRPVASRDEVMALARILDRHIDARLASERVSASPLADDAEFLRRVCLDLTGRIPTADRTVAFLEDRDPAKRDKLIDELGAGADFGKHLADRWQMLLIPRNSENRRIPFDPLTKWLEERFNANRPWDQIVKELLTAEGNGDANGAITWYLANRELDKLTDNVSRMFLGVQLQCAQCHNHPFTEWKQDAYWGMAAFFSKVRFQGNPRNPMRLGEGIVLNESERGRPLARPDSAKALPPTYLQGGQAPVDPRGPYRPALAGWLTSPSNPYFARAAVNRTWAQLFGRGIVNPVDDMHDGNVPSHPDLLKELTAQFAGHGFDLNYLYRAICYSRAYQRSSKPTGSNAEASPDLYARMAVKPMSAEQLFDSLVSVIGTEPGQPGAGQPRPASREERMQQKQQAKANTPPALRGPNASIRNFFIAMFGTEEGDNPADYNAGIPQVLALMNGRLTGMAIFRTIPELRGGGPPVVIDRLYLRTLNRRPSDAERERMLAYVRGADAPGQAFGDILWALLNSSEFALNH